MFGKKKKDDFEKMGAFEQWKHDRRVNAWNKKYDTTDGGKHPGRFMYGTDILCFEDDICNYDNHMKRTFEIREIANHIDDPDYRIQQPGESDRSYKLRMFYLDDLTKMSTERYSQLIEDPKKKWERRRPGLLAKYMALNPHAERDYTKRWHKKKNEPYLPLF